MRHPGPGPRAASVPALLCLLALAAAASLPAQVVERQVPVDSTLDVFEITPELRNSLDLFPGVPGFESARLFSTDAGTFVLEITARREGRLIRTRRLLDPEELTAFRADLGRRAAALDAPLVRSREGRGELVLGHTLLALGFHGWAVPVVLDLDSTRGRVAAYLLTAGAGFYLPYHLTRNRSVTEAHRRLSLWGASRGGIAGATLGGLLEGDGGDERVHLGLALAGSVAGSLGGFAVAGSARPEEGTAALWSAMGDFGMAFGFGSALAAGFYDRESVIAENGFSEESYVNLRAGNALGLLGTGAGLLAGRWMGEREDYTVGDATVLRASGLLGAHVALPVANALDADDEGHVAAALVGAAAGIGVGDRLLRPESFSAGQGILVAVGQLAGGLSALGLAYLVDDGADELTYLTTSALGSVAGFTLTFRALGGGSR